MTAAAAIARARAIRGGAVEEPPRPVRGRTFAIGDPQTSADRFFGALAAHGLLGGDGWLRPDVRLISMGDHFDYAVRERLAAQVEGVVNLGWLAAHAPAHVAILAGNHDLARVMEFAAIDDARFAEAAALGRRIGEAAGEARAGLAAELRARFPDVATPGYAARDYNAFTVEQRALVQRLLLAGRLDLARAERALDGTPVLLTHAGLTTPHLAQLGVALDPAAIADALNARLREAVGQVAGAWRAGRAVPLSLEPLYTAGSDGAEAGGMVIHRPADLDRDGADHAWQSARGGRRFDPRALPAGLAQLIGHTGHRKAFHELARWREAGMTDEVGGLRTVRATAGGDVSYARGIHALRPGDAVLWMIDPEMHYVARDADVAVLELA